VAGRDGVVRVAHLEVGELHYPAKAFVLLAGVPGAGKTTLLHRLFGPGNAHVRVLDSAETRERWMPRLGWLPYGLWRPVAHSAHYLRVLAAIRAVRERGPLVVPDCGTRPWVRWLFVRQARRSRVPLHVVLLDVTEAEGRAGQEERRRKVSSRSYRRHCRRWRALLVDPYRLLKGAESVLVLDRKSADDLRAMCFDQPVRFD
jgi:predicted kinase